MLQLISLSNRKLVQLWTQWLTQIEAHLEGQVLREGIGTQCNHERHTIPQKKSHHRFIGLNIMSSQALHFSYATCASPRHSEYQCIWYDDAYYSEYAH